MDITVDLDDQMPLFNQLIEQIKNVVAQQNLPAHFCLPSIRQLANDLGINANTVAKAYKLLERDSIIITKGYRGTFFHPDAQQNCQVDLNHQARKYLGNTITKLRDLGLTDSEIRIAFNNNMRNK